MIKLSTILYIMSLGFPCPKSRYLWGEFLYFEIYGCRSNFSPFTLESQGVLNVWKCFKVWSANAFFFFLGGGCPILHFVLKTGFLLNSAHKKSSKTLLKHLTQRKMVIKGCFKLEKVTQIFQHWFHNGRINQWMLNNLKSQFCKERHTSY